MHSLTQCICYYCHHVRASVSQSVGHQSFSTSFFMQIEICAFSTLVTSNQHHQSFFIKLTEIILPRSIPHLTSSESLNVCFIPKP